MHRHSPTVRLRRLSAELRRIREEQGLTVVQAARQAGWQQSKLSRAENRQWRQPDVEGVARLLDVYGVTEEAAPQRRAELLELARQARWRSWWADYPASATYATYVGLEAEAKVVRNWEPTVVPGLLQTPGYARAIITTRAPDLSAEEVSGLFELRMQRQRQVFAAGNPLTVMAIVSEAVLLYEVGGAAIMAEQLEHLHKAAQMPNVHLWVLPFSAGIPPAAGPFAVLTFHDPQDLEAVYVETPAGDLWVEEEAKVGEFSSSFERLISTALKTKPALRLIAERAADLRSRG